LERWRRGQIGRTALAFVRDQPHRITWHDQCALNHVLRGSWLALQPKWNLQTHMIGAFRGYDFVATQEGLKRLEDAAIVHFTTNWKPWLYRCRHPHRAQYWRYL